MRADPARFFWHKIAETTGSTLRQAKRETTRLEFVQWLAYFEIRDGDPDDRPKSTEELQAKIRHAFLTAQALNDKESG